MSDSVRPHRQQPTRLPCPWDSPGKNTGLEWVAISFSNAWKWKVKVKSLIRVRLLVTPWTAAYQTPLSMGFSRQEYWSGVPLPSPVYFWVTIKSPIPPFLLYKIFLSCWICNSVINSEYLIKDWGFFCCCCSLLNAFENFVWGIAFFLYIELLFIWFFAFQFVDLYGADILHRLLFLAS